MHKILRVFPRRTKATPDDNLTVIGYPDLFTFEKDFTEIHISCTFKKDRKLSEDLFKVYSRHFQNTKLGGVAFGDPGGEFIPGKYLKPGYVITSRGCPNDCWFCDVPGREGPVRELEIKNGHNVLDSNLLACSDSHIKKVYAMLKQQKQKAEFTGGIEAARLQEWHVKLFADLKPKQIFFAYDTQSDRDPLFEAGKLLQRYDLNHSHRLRCYVLIGYKNDTFEKAEKRLKETMAAGFFPMAMLYRQDDIEPEKSWKQFQRKWARPELIYAGANKCE